MLKRLGTVLSSMALVSLVFSPCMAFAAEVPSAAEKTETVTVTTNASGEVEKIKVSATLKNPDKLDEIADFSNLSDIKGEDDATYTVSGGDLIWKASGEDVSYTGTTSGQLPIGMKVTYKLDGNEVQPADIAGKSGEVSIRYDFVNTSTFTAYVNGVPTEMHMPFTCITALMLDGDRFSNIEVSNGKVVDDGSDTVVTGYVMPGLKQSLGSLVDNSNIPEYFEVKATAQDFSLKSSMTIVTAGLMSDLNVDEFGLDDFDGASSGLSEGISQLIEGADGVASGISQLADGADQLSAGVDGLAYGIDSLSGGLSAFTYGTESQPGLKDVASSSDELVGGLEEMDTALSTAVTDPKVGLQTASDGLSTLAETYDAADIKSLKAAIEASDMDPASKKAVEGILESTGQVSALSKFISGSTEGLTTLSSEHSKLTKQASGLPDGLWQAYNAAEQLTGSSKTLAGGAYDLSSATDEFSSGLHGAADGAGQLKAGLITYEEEGISKIVKTIDDDIGGLKKRLAALSNAAKGYDNFAGKKPGTASSVKFVYETAAINAE